MNVSKTAIKNAMIDFITRYPFSHSVMLPFNFKDHHDWSSLSSRPLHEKESYLRKRVQLFFMRVEKNLYGGGKKAERSLTYFAVFEDETKFGNPTHFHVHMLVAIEPGMYEDFIFWLEHHWLKLNFPPEAVAHLQSQSYQKYVRRVFLRNIHLKPIENLRSAASYMLKQSKFEPFENISERHQREFLEKRAA